MNDTDRTIRLHLSNNSSIDMEVAEKDVEVALRDLGEVCVNPGAIFTFDRHDGGTLHVPSPSLLMFELLPA